MSSRSSRRSRLLLAGGAAAAAGCSVDDAFGFETSRPFFVSDCCLLAEELADTLEGFFFPEDDAEDAEPEVEES
uniref:Putative secreted protein n=1 Tax=Anopheles marajoara TaxID=58244 RepID=A0A2M4CDI1_9DIPT